MSYEQILYELSDTTAVVTINRPDKMNTWNAGVASELSQALGQANMDDNVRAVVITGAGRAFCAGADLERGEETFAGRDEKKAEGGGDGEEEGCEEAGEEGGEAEDGSGGEEERARSASLPSEEVGGIKRTIELQ